MPNIYYNNNDNYVPGQKIASAEIDAQFEAIEDGFDKIKPFGFGAEFGGIDIGVANQYNVITTDEIQEPVDLRFLLFQPLETNTGISTVRLNGGVAYPVVRNDGEPVSFGDMIASVVLAMVYEEADERWTLIGATSAQVREAFRPKIKTVTDLTYTLIAGDETSVILFTAGCAITVPSNADAPLPIGYIVHLHQSGSDTITVAGAAGVTVVEATSKMTRTQYSSLSMIKVATNTWHIIGDMKPI
jgi:hypothetical protein